MNAEVASEVRKREERIAELFGHALGRLMIERAPELPDLFLDLLEDLLRAGPVESEA